MEKPIDKSKKTRYNKVVRRIGKTASAGGYTEKYSRGRRGAPAKGVGRLNRRESSNLSFSAMKETWFVYQIRFLSMISVPCRNGWYTFGMISHFVRWYTPAGVSRNGYYIMLRRRSNISYRASARYIMRRSRISLTFSILFFKKIKKNKNTQQKTAERRFFVVVGCEG